MDASSPFRRLSYCRRMDYTIFSAIVEIFDFRPDFLICGHTAQGSKMDYDTGKFIDGLSNRMTGLYGICSPAM